MEVTGPRRMVNLSENASVDIWDDGDFVIEDEDGDVIILHPDELKVLLKLIANEFSL